MSHTYWVLYCLCYVLLSKTADSEPLPQARSQRSSSTSRRPPTITEQPMNVVAANADTTARLYCRADGFPKPDISWLKDGEPLSDANVRDITMLSPGEILLFRIRSKGSSANTGMYQCIASNDLGRVASNNASVQIASIRGEFRTNPRDTVAAKGGSVTLECEGPRGYPEPAISWTRDNTALESNERLKVKPGGNLVINRLQKSDSGTYYCIASNDAGERRSTGALLMVQEPPRFTVVPSNQVVQVGQTVEVQCKAEGDPRPSIKWSRKDGTMPQNRLVPMSNGNMRISGVQLADEGEYVCTAENRVGKESASAFVEIQAEPEIIDLAGDTTAQIGDTVVLKCRVQGKPIPTVFWRGLHGSEMFMENSYQEGHLFVAASGDLVIYNARFDDQGLYVCQAMNPLATVSGEIQLTIQPRKTTTPPPIIRRAPTNATVAQNSDIILHCSSDSVPKPDVKWYKDGQLVQSGSNWPRTTQLLSGSLKIRNTETSDAGRYTCKASNIHGYDEWSAWVRVLGWGANIPSFPTNQDLPRAPSEPNMVNSTSSYVTLTWKPSSNTGGSPIQYYILDYYRIRSSSANWQRISLVQKRILKVNGLQASSDYIFIVRTVNQKGASEPSPVSQYMRTKDETFITPPLNLDPRHQKLDAVAVRITQALPLANLDTGTWSVRLSWTTSSICGELDGFIVLSQAVSRENSKTNQKAVSCLRRTSDLTGLRSGTKYEIRILPMRGQLVGRPSPVVYVSAQKGIMEPMSPVLTVNAQQNPGEVSFQWQPPSDVPATHVSKYILTLRSQDGDVERSVQVNSSTTAVTLSDLPGNTAYLATVTYSTSLGDGVTSDEEEVTVTASTDETEIGALLQQPAVIAGLCTALLVIVLVIVGVCWYRRSRKNRKLSGLPVRSFSFSPPAGSHRGHRREGFDIPYSAAFQMTKTTEQADSFADGGREVTPDGPDGGRVYLQRSGGNATSNSQNTVVKYNIKNGELEHLVEESPPSSAALPTQTSFSYVTNQLTSKTDILPHFTRTGLAAPQPNAVQPSQHQQFIIQRNQSGSAFGGVNSPESDPSYTANNYSGYTANARNAGNIPPPHPSPPLSQRTAISDRSRASSGKQSTAERSSRSGQKSKRGPRGKRSENVGQLPTDAVMITHHNHSPARTEDLLDNTLPGPPIPPTRGASCYPYSPHNRETTNLGYLAGPSDGETDNETSHVDPPRHLRPFNTVPDPRTSVTVSNVSMMNGFGSESDVRDSSCDQDSCAALSSDEEFNMESASQVGQNLIPERNIAQRPDRSHRNVRSGAKTASKRHLANTYHHYPRDDDPLLEETSGHNYSSSGVPNPGKSSSAKVRLPKMTNNDLNRANSPASSSSSYHHNTGDSGMSAGVGCSTEHNSLNSSVSARSKREGPSVNCSRTAENLTSQQNLPALKIGSKLPSLDFQNVMDGVRAPDAEYPSPGSPTPSGVSEQSGYMSTASSCWQFQQPSPVKGPFQMYPSNSSLPVHPIQARPSNFKDSKVARSLISKHMNSPQRVSRSPVKTPVISDYDITPTNNFNNTQCQFQNARNMFASAGAPKTDHTRGQELSDVPEVSTSDYCEEYSDQSQ